MSEVVIVGIGQAPVGEHWDVTLRALALTAIEEALREAEGLRPQALFVANALAPVLSRQGHLATLVADFAGLHGIEAMTVEAGGASGGAALRAAYQAIASGEVACALVVGVEKATDQVGPVVEAAQTIEMDADYEAEHGLSTAAQAALLMQRYMHEYGVPREAFAPFTLLAHRHAVGNPHAMFRTAVSEKAYARANMLADPVSLLDAAPVADGAAAVLLARRDILPPAWPHPLVRIAGSAIATDTLALHDREDPLAFQAVAVSAQRAWQRAGLTPEDIDLWELFDAFSVYVPLTLEALGLAPRGEGWKLGQDGQLDLDGAYPSLTMGGLKGRGHPVGATGVYQVVEATLQLRGQAGDNQVTNASRALVQCFGGPASTVVTHILERLE